VSETSQGPGWWLASDGRWYPPQPDQPGLVPPYPPQQPMQYPSTPYYYQSAPPRTNGLAIASLVCALVPVLGIGAILGIIFGVVARRQIRDSGGTQTGEGLGLAGIIIGSIQLVLVPLLVIAAVVFFSTALPRLVGVASCQVDANRIETALNDYRQKTGDYPSPPAPWSATTYVSNFFPLTNASNGGPWLTFVPPTNRFVIEYDGSGRIWVEPPGRYDPLYDPRQDVSSPSACLTASR